MTDKPCTLVRICPFTKTVEAVEWSGIGRDLNSLIAPPDGEGSGLFTFAPCGAVDIVVDDEGLYFDWPAFHFAGYPQNLSGRGLVVSVDDHGNTIPALDVDTVRRMTVFDQTPATPRMEVLTGDDALRAMGML